MSISPPQCTMKFLEVRSLYVTGKHKQCAALCEHLQQQVEHSVHKAFLYYYQALCHEFIASTVHKFSSSKLPLLQRAHQSLQHALEQISQLERNVRMNQMFAPGRGVIDVDLGDKSIPDVDTAQIGEVSCCTGDLVESIEPHIIKDEDANHEKTLSSIRMEARTDLSPQNTDFSCSVRSDKSPETPNTGQTAKRRGRSKARLSESLSSSHVLAEDLIPSPLNASYSIGARKSSLYHKALPPLPLDPSTTPASKSKLLVTIPTRKTTVESLIAKFESAPSTPGSPLTPRYSRISRAFQCKTNDEDAEAIILPKHLTKFNERLRQFQKFLITRAEHFQACIEAATAQQHQHKTQRATRLASFWSFDPILLASSSSVTTSELARRNRLMRLKASDCIVTKEKHGWKGQAYYDALRNRAQADIC